MHCFPYAHSNSMNLSLEPISIKRTYSHKRSSENPNKYLSKKQAASMIKEAIDTGKCQLLWRVRREKFPFYILRTQKRKKHHS